MTEFQVILELSQWPSRVPHGFGCSPACCWGSPAWRPPPPPPMPLSTSSAQARPLAENERPSVYGARPAGRSLPHPRYRRPAHAGLAPRDCRHRCGSTRPPASSPEPRPGKAGRIRRDSARTEFARRGHAALQDRGGRRACPHSAHGWNDWYTHYDHITADWSAAPPPPWSLRAWPISATST